MVKLINCFGSDFERVKLTFVMFKITLEHIYLEEIDT